MSPLRRLRALLNFFRRARIERDMQAEMQAHLELQTERNLAAGMNPEEAQYSARRQFGGVTQIQERARAQRSWRGFESFLQDCRYALRQTRKQPGFTIASVLTLALGIGFVTTLFTVVNGIAFRSLPFDDAGQIVSVGIPSEQLDAYAGAQTSFTGLAAVRSTRFTVAREEAVTRQPGAVVSPEVFRLLRVPAMQGRVLTLEDAKPGAAKVVLLGAALWRQEFRGDPAILQQTLRINGEPHAVVGVMPDEFGFPRTECLWVPLATNESASGSIVVGRLKPGITRTHAAEELGVIRHRLVQDGGPAGESAAHIGVVPFTERTVKGAVRNLLFGILVATFLVLALACANVANLILVRATERGREFALRAALGASRGRLLAQMLTESLILGVAGSALGALGAHWGTHLLWNYMMEEKDLTGGVPFWMNFEMDGRVAAFVALTALLTSVLTGLVPALRASRPHLVEQIKNGGGTTGGASRLTRRLVNVQIALSVCLVVAAGLFLTLLIDFNRKVLPYDPRAVLTARLALDDATLFPAEQRAAVYENLLTQLGAQPRVAGVAATSAESFRASQRRIAFEDATPAAPGREPGALSASVSPDYFAVLGMELRDGRGLQAGDTVRTPAVAVVNTSFAARFGEARGIIGRRFRMVERSAAGVENWITVVGVVTDSGSVKAGVATDGPQFYRPLAQEPAAAVTLLLRSAQPDATLPQWLRRTVAATHPDLPLNQVHPVQRILEMERVGINIPGVLLVLCGLGALALASVGVYGVVSFSVKTRTREFGVRMALGADRRGILRHVMAGGLRQISVGLGAGVILALAASAVLSSLFHGFGRSAFDVPIYLGVMGLITGVAALALWLPARRAARVDPMVALRAE